MDQNEAAFVVEGWPPAKNEAKSMLAAGHPYADRVLHLLRAAAVVVGHQRSPTFGGDALGLELIVKFRDGATQRRNQLSRRSWRCA